MNQQMQINTDILSIKYWQVNQSAKINYINTGYSMLFQKKRRKINNDVSKDKQKEDSTQNSDEIPSSDKKSSQGDKKRQSLKSFSKILSKQISQKNLSFKQSFDLKNCKIYSPDQENSEAVYYQTTNGYFEKHRLIHEHISSQKQLAKQGSTSCLKNDSMHSQKINSPQHCGLTTSKKKFKLYCQVKKLKVLDKKSQLQKQPQKITGASTVSQSCVKNSVLSKNSDPNKSISTQKSLKQNSIKRKINLTQKIKQIKSKQKIVQNKKSQQKSASKIKDSNSKQKNLSSKISLIRNKKVLSKKHSTLNLKKSREIFVQKQQNYETEKDKEKIEIRIGKINKDQDELKKTELIDSKTKILPENSQIIEQSVNKLSSIKEEKNQDTISRSLKINDATNLQNSVSKNDQQTMMHLSINSNCPDNRRSLKYILETTEIKESNLRKSIESSLSQIQKTRQKISIQKFKQPKKIGQMGSEISQIQQSMTTIQKIQFHIEIINTLSNFVYKSTELEYLMQDWDELNFLIYKKFYIERTKVLNFLKKYPIKNPFCIKRACIETKEILLALRQNAIDIKRIKDNLETENAAIKKNLLVFYEQFSSDKHGQKINMFEYDNFSHWIYKQLWDEIQLFSYSQSHNQTELEDRICKSLQAGFLISELNGNFVTPFEDAEIASYQKKQKAYIEDNLKIFQRYVLNKKK